MSKIIQLPENLANMIAAGEVVERPANVVKELVENSFDAGSTQIKIDLIEAGLEKITVTDNGSGIEKDQIPVALKRHATSKISSVEDLFSISSLGFRGEALPSIASVSIFTITSSTDGNSAYYYKYKGLELVSEGVTSLPKGTKIEVEKLFYNVPARLKYLSSNANELSLIMSFITKYAIAYPEVSFNVTNNGKTIFKTTGKDSIEELLGNIYGLSTAKNMIPFKGSNNLYTISGMCSNNSVYRSNKNGITIIINKRLIKNQSIQYAITDAYKTILPVGKYPVVVLEIKCQSSLIDVNVHPSKLEIKFTDEYLLKNLITNSIKNALYEEPLIYHENTTLPREDENKKVEELPTQTPKMTNNNKTEQKEILDWDDFLEEDDQIYDDSKEEKEEISVEIENENKQPILLEEENDTAFFTKLNYIGQYNLTYLLMEYDNDLYLIDQHAAMERWMYEKISKEFEKEKQEFFELLIPFNLEFSVSEINIIQTYFSELLKLGITCELFGNNTIIIRTIPTWIKIEYAESYVRDIINHMMLLNTSPKAKVMDSLAKSLSCKKSIKADTLIRIDEVNTLMKNLDTCKMPYTCPHGRPTLIKFSLYEIEKMFKRVM